MTPTNLTPNQIHALRSTLVRLADAFLSSHSARARASRHEVLRQMVGDDVCRRCGIVDLPEDFLLSVVIPVFNERETVAPIIDRVRECGLPCEIIVVDDGSNDGTREILRELQPSKELQLLFRQSNDGKGAAVKDGLAHVTGDVVVIQDADMEYDPQDYNAMLGLIVDGLADVVYGSRYLPFSESRSPWWHRAGNRLITWLFDMTARTKLTDVETCYKMFRRNVIDRIAPSLNEKGFGIEIELTAKLAKLKNVRIREVPITYFKRGYAEGKKIGWRDAVWAVWCIFRY